MRTLILALFLIACGAYSQTFEFRPLRQTNRETILQLSAPSGQSVRIDASSDPTKWNGLVTLRSAGLNSHTDTATPFLTQRFYRAEQVETNALTGDHLVTTNGDVVIHPLYHASLLMSWNGKIIYNDPDDEGIFESRYVGMPKADLILVGHAHGDHFSNAKINAIRNTNVVVIAPQIVWNGMDTTLRGLTTVLANGGTTNVFGIRIDAIPAYNTNNNNHPVGVGNGYVVTIGGKRIYFSGDTSNIPEMRALQNIDVAFLCMNSFTMAPADAVNAANAVYFKNQLGPATGIEVRLRPWY
jgi:L-ascorbate metabolism protein UlaG (beta-lactamase superfamily)